MPSIYSEIDRCKRGALCTIVATKGSTPRKVGAKMLVRADGSIAGSIGGGALEQGVIQNALGVMESGMAHLFSHALVQDHMMCCGGSLDIFIEPIVGKKALYIFGAGHIGSALAKLAQQLDFAVTLIDERPQQLPHIEGVATINQPHQEAFAALEFDAASFVCVITHNHAYDREIVVHCAQQPHAYLGMIGSQRKVEMARKAFLDAGQLTEAQMANIDWPMGLDIAAETPAEIAVAILAKLIDVRSKLS